MATTKTKFNELRETIVSAANIFGLTRNDLHKNWDMDYYVNLDRDFKYTINNINEDVKLLKQAIQRRDMITAITTLVTIKVRSHYLLNFFEDLNDDLNRIGWGKEFKDKWPEIPKDYLIPSDYDYENTNLPYEEREKHSAAFNAEEDRLDELEQRPKPKVLTLRKKTSSD